MNTIPALIHKANDSLHAARFLASEGLFDLAVGRAYFAMHYVAMAFLLTHKLPLTDPADVVEAFAQRFAYTNELPAIFNRNLVEAYRLWQKAEFNTDTDITAATVTEQLERARAFFLLGKEELADTAG